MVTITRDQGEGHEYLYLFPKNSSFILSYIDISRLSDEDPGQKVFDFLLLNDMYYYIRGETSSSLVVPKLGISLI